MNFRIKSALIHLAISLLFGLVAVYLVFFVWHPNPLQTAVGVTAIFVMMLAIDVVLGPVLTLLVASSPNKKTLKFDLTVIAIVQLTAYLYGLYNITISRPVYIAYDNGLFELVQADTVYRQTNKPILPQYQNNPILSIEWVYIPPYSNLAEQEERMRLEMQEAITPAMQATLYQPIQNAWQSMQDKKTPLKDLTLYNNADVVQAVLKNYSNADGYFGLKAPEVEMTILIDSKNKQILDIVDLRPW